MNDSPVSHGTPPSDRGIGPMLIFSLLLHVAVVALLASNAFRLHHTPRPVFYVDLESLPAVDLPVSPPQPVEEPPPAEEAPVVLAQKPEAPRPVRSEPPAPAEAAPAPRPEPVKPAERPEPPPQPKAEPPMRPKPAPVAPAKPQAPPEPVIALPQPKARTLAPPRTENRPVLPHQAARVQEAPEPELIEPSITRYDPSPPSQPKTSLAKETTRLPTGRQTPDLAAPALEPTPRERRNARESLPSQQQVALGSAPRPAVDIDPALRPLKEREGRDQALPLPAPVALAATERPAVEIAPAASGERYRRQQSDSLPAQLPRSEVVGPAPSPEAAILQPTGPGVLPKQRTAPAAGAPGNAAVVSLAPQGAPEVRLDRPAAVVPAAAGTASAPGLPAAASANFDALDTLGADGLDPSVLVSLNRLRTCRDPEAENRLKTRLATLLSRPQLCRSGGVVFAFQNPETAWSIHVDLYNYEQRNFQDRCEALELAVKCCERSRR